MLVTVILLINKITEYLYTIIYIKCNNLIQYFVFNFNSFGFRLENGIIFCTLIIIFIFIYSYSMNTRINNVIGDK